MEPESGWRIDACNEFFRWRVLKLGLPKKPFLCNYPLAIEVKTNPYVELGEYLSQHPDQKERALETLAYFDPLNLVEMITRPMLVNIGMKRRRLSVTTRLFLCF